MGIVSVLSLSITFGYIGYIFGASMRQIEASEVSKSEAYKEGYIKGYSDCWASVKKATKKYYDDFPDMGIN
jgi:hypothetical protein